MLKLVLVWLTAIGLAVASVFLSIGAISKTRAPRIAVSVWPTNGFAQQNVAAAKLNQQILAEQNRFPAIVDPEILKLASEAFQREPATSKAVAILALGSDQKDNDKLMRKALQLSKRDNLALAWLIGESAKNNRIDELLGYYDMSLRTNRRAAQVLLPAMSMAVANPESIAPFRKLLEQNPPWGNGFWGQVLSKPESLTNATVLRLELMDRGVEMDFQDRLHVTRLVENGLFDDAEQLFERLAGHSRPDGELLHNNTFDNEPQFQPLDWQIYNTGDYGAYISDGSLQLSSIDDVTRIFARQLASLPATKLMFRAEVANLNNEASEVYLEIKCAERDLANKAPKPVRLSLRQGKNNQVLDASGSSCRRYWISIGGGDRSESRSFEAVISELSIIQDVR